MVNRPHGLNYDSALAKRLAREKLRLRRMEDRLSSTFVETKRLRSVVSELSAQLELTKVDNFKRDA